MDCFREGPNFLVIDPDECIDSADWITECPVYAIYRENDVPSSGQQAFIVLYVELATSWSLITKFKAALHDTEKWKDIKNKLDELVK